MSPALPRPPRGSLDLVQAAALLLPALVLAWPGDDALLDGVPTAESSGAAVAALAALPAVALLALRRFTWRSPALVPLLVTSAVAALTRPGVADTFEASRALLVGATGVGLLLAGATLGPRGARLLARALPLVTIAWIAPALLAQHDWTGVLENTGDLSEAALGGAVAGLVVAPRGPLSWRLAGAAAALAYLAHAALVPVYAGLVAFGLGATAAVATLRRSGGRGLRVALAAGVLALGAVGLRLAEDARGPGAEEALAAGTPAASTNSTGGFGFRARTWARVPALVADHLWLGVGPGQFLATFPPYRDPIDVERASFGHRAPYETQVEHAHNDWLEGFAEYGLVGGSAWVAFLALVAAAAVRRLRADDPERAALGAAALALLANAFVNAPLLGGPVAHAVAFPVFGAVLGGATRVERRRVGPTLLSWLALLALALQVPDALGMLGHGGALARLSAEAEVVRDGRRLHDAGAEERVLERALAARPDSTVALAEHAALLRATGASDEDVVAAWRSVLAHQPHRVDAWLAIGNAEARAGRFAEAREAYERVRALDPAHPETLRNGLVLALDEGRPDRVAQALSELDARGLTDPAWLARLGAEELLRARPHLGLPLLERVDPSWVPRSGEEALALALSFDERGEPLLADAMRAQAQLTWAREHLERGDAEAAVRSYRQFQRIAAGYAPLRAGAPLVRLQLAAALRRAGRAEEGRELLEGFEPSPVELGELAELAPWARDELREAGWLR